jgi:hypothetical protein
MTLCPSPEEPARTCLLGPNCPCREIPDSLVREALTAANSSQATQSAQGRPSLAHLLQVALADRRRANYPERDFPPES